MAKAKFLIDFAQCGNITRSAAVAGINRRTVTTWRTDDPKFRDIYEAALEEALDRLEEEARRRAVDGVLEPVVSAGALVAHVRKYSDTLLITLLKGKRPDTFRERHEITGKDGGPLITPQQAAAMTDDELKAAMLAQSARLAAAAEQL